MSLRIALFLMVALIAHGQTISPICSRNGFGLFISPYVSYGNCISITTSTSTSQATQTTQVTRQVDQVKSRITAHLAGGAFVYDQTFSAPFSDASVQNAVNAARLALQPIASPSTVTGPVLLSSVVTSSGPISANVIDRQVANDYSVLIDTIGPETIFIGPWGACAGVNITGDGKGTPFGCPPGQGVSFLVTANSANTDIHTHTHTQIFQTTTTTTTNVTTTTYEIVGQAANSGCTLGVPAITSIQSLTDFGSFTTFNTGSWLEIKGTNFAAKARVWTGDDFQGVNAPTGLDGTSTSVNGKPSFMYYVSPTQVNIQVPTDAAIGMVPITVTNCAGTSLPVAAQKVALSPGILAPAAFKIGGRQYAVAQFPDLTFVGTPNLIAGAAFRPVKPGQAITIYGIGFGDVTPNNGTAVIGPGAIVGQLNSVSGLTVKFNDLPATTTYFGLSPGLVGLYQFDVIVPDVPDGDVQVKFNIRGTDVAQTLFLTVKH